ncbi:sensor histidine kinase [Taibaiella chishuiensis]|uniref:histidine kinase n=1 Tax=Taibaiella chishuiensis TaxID=1434707 RepID=A0A2P8D4L9_9BACT|nr:histidine kinase [Taibaiella chishuiensis]PSK92155.1 histidine kinase/DNA gyrase B/HSP90-like ATPase [Taibaiella chishuiensis]
MNTTSIVILGVSAMLLMAMGVIVFVVLYQRRVIQTQIQIEQLNHSKQQELLHASIQSEEEERMRIASELHDDVAPTLASIRLYLSTAAGRPDDNSLILQSKVLLDESLQKIRNIAHKLQPSTLYYLGLQVSLQSLADMINNSESVQASYTIAQDIPRLEEQTELSVYRVVQELTNNIIKHAHARSLTISSALQEQQLIVSIHHNGIGITQQLYEELIYKKGAIGLKNIMTRLKSIRAQICFEQLEANAFAIRLTVPFTLP